MSFLSKATWRIRVEFWSVYSVEPVRCLLWEVSCGLCCTRWEVASASIY